MGRLRGCRYGRSVGWTSKRRTMDSGIAARFPLAWGHLSIGAGEKGSGTPDPGRNEVVQLIVFAILKPLRHRLNALAIARTDQPRHAEWTHLWPLQPIRKRLEKASKLFFP